MHDSSFTSAKLKPRRLCFGALLLLLGANYFSWAPEAAAAERILIVLPAGEASPAMEIAVQRLREYSGAAVDVVHGEAADSKRGADLTVNLGVDLLDGLTDAAPDSYAVRTTRQAPLAVTATGTNERSTLYAAYCLADLLKRGAPLAELQLLFQPKVRERYVSFGATTHGRRQYRPELYWRTLRELPRYGYNGVIIYPGGGTPLGRHASPITENADGTLSAPEDAAAWHDWLAQIDDYDLEVMMTVPPVVPPGYSRPSIRAFYAGGPEPPGYLAALKRHFRNYLQLLKETYPGVDRYMFNSTEGATFGKNERFFGHPSPRFPADDYLRNNEAVMRAYFDVLSDEIADDQIYFWTHSFGITSQGIAREREVLFDYPDVTIIEDDFWNNNLWPMDLPAMAYLPEDLRAEVSNRNRFAMFQIATDGEYYGGGSLPNAYPDSHIRSANDAVERGARMVIQRLDLHDRTEQGTVHGAMEIVPLAAARQLWTPTAETDAIWHDWAERRFGKEAVPHVVAALRESKTVLHKGLSCQGIDLLAVGSEFIPRLWASNVPLSRFHLFGRPGRRMLDKGPGNVIESAEYTVFQMDSHTISIDQFRRDQAEALAAIERGQAAIERAKPTLTAADYEMLQGIFADGENVLHAMCLLGEAAYATNLRLDNFDAVDNPAKLQKRALADLRSYLSEGKLIAPMTANLEKIAADYEQAVKGRAAP